MKKIIPPASDALSLGYFMAILLAFNICAYWMPLWVRAAYGAWLAVGVAYVVSIGVEPGLPITFMSNLRRILRAHVWPLYR